MLGSPPACRAVFQRLLQSAVTVRNRRVGRDRVYILRNIAVVKEAVLVPRANPWRAFGTQLTWRFIRIEGLIRTQSLAGAKNFKM